MTNVIEAQRQSPVKACPHCGGTDLYSRRIPAGGVNSPWLLMGLGSFMHFAECDVVVCADCGLTQLFAEPAACQKLKSSSAWQKV
jgi:predicted nucleic-acid-binding Zn-ribbon protein